MTRLNSSKSSMPACRVRVMPVSGAQHAWAHEMLQAAVHSMYIRPGYGPGSSGRTGGASSFLSGSFSAQSPQNFDPPAFRSPRSAVIVGPVQVSRTDPLRASPRTRRPYGSAHPHTNRPSQSITRMSHGHVQRNRVERKFSDTGLFPRELLHVRLELVVLVAHGIQEQAVCEVRTPLVLRHLVDPLVDFLHHVVEGPPERTLRCHLPVEQLHDGEQVPVERALRAGRGLDGAHGYAPKLSSALDSSA